MICPFKENEVGEIEYPEIARFIDWIDNFVVVFFSLEYIVRYLISEFGFKKSSLIRVHAPRFHPVDKWNSKVELKSSLSGVKVQSK